MECWAVIAFNIVSALSECLQQERRRESAVPITLVTPSPPVKVSPGALDARCLAIPFAIPRTERLIVVFRDFAPGAQCFGVYENGELVMRNDVLLRGLASTGQRGHETPLTLTSKPQAILRAHRVYHSKEYDGAAMPHSLFFTDKGHAVHGSDDVNTIRASHGCVRISLDMAKRVFDYYEESHANKFPVSVIVTTNREQFMRAWGTSVPVAAR